MQLFNNNDTVLHLPPTSSKLHSRQVENCDRNSRLVVDEDDNSKFRLDRINQSRCDSGADIVVFLINLCCNQRSAARNL